MSKFTSLNLPSNPWTNFYLILVLALLCITATSASASQINITARFLPDSNRPDLNTFENTTPQGGYCTMFTCGAGTFSLSMPNITGNTLMVAGEGISLSVPHAWRELLVTHDDGSSQTMKVRIVGMGARYRLNQSTSNHGGLWIGGTWLYAPTNCSGMSYGSFTAWAYSFFWRFNSSNPCTKVSVYSQSPGLFFDSLNFMYELQTPDPLAMSVGTYRGSTTYTIGPGGDFTFGSATANDPVVTLNFTLSVQHNLRVQFPPATNLISLQPQGGWQQWILNGEHLRPKKLLANQPYQLWSSTRFKMSVQCQYPIGNDCGIQNDAGNLQIPVKTFTTLPYGMRDSNNSPVNHQLLSNNSTRNFTATRYTSNERATMHFEVENADVEKMVTSGGGRFRGDVTVIWDSDI